MSIQADAKGGANVLVHFDPADPPDSVVALQDAIKATSAMLGHIKGMLSEARLNVAVLEGLADRLSSHALEVEECADELATAARAATGLTVTDKGE